MTSYFCKENTFFYSWLDNIKNNHINQEILLLIFDIFPQDRVNKFKQITKELHSLENGHKILIREIDNIEKIIPEKNNKNVILIGYPHMDIKYIEDINVKILFCSCEPNFLKKEILPIDKSELLISNNKEEYIIKKRNPIEIIKNYDVFQMVKFIYSYFYNQHSKISKTLFQNIGILQSNPKSIIQFLEWEQLIQKDIELLYSSKKFLTARLANVIYKVATLEFNANSTQIGLYYSKKFNVESKNKRLSGYADKSISLKIYNLTEWWS